MLGNDQLEEAGSNAMPIIVRRYAFPFGLKKYKEREKNEQEWRYHLHYSFPTLQE